MMIFFIVAAALVFLMLAGLVIFSAYTARRVELALPPRGHFLEVDGARIHYLEQGSGSPIVILHGLGGQLGNFTYALLERLTPEFRVVLVDRPGSGYSTRARGASPRLRAQAATIAHFIRALGLERPLLVGHSLGGAVSLALALDHPNCIRGLALVAPRTHVREKVPDMFKSLFIRSKSLRWLLAWTIAIPLSIRRGKTTLAAIFAPEAPPPDFRTKAGGLLGLRPRSFYNTSTDLMSADADLPAMVERYPTLKMPVSILYGTNDHVLEYEVHGVAMKSKVPGLQLELVDGGHMLPITAPDVTAAFIKRAALRQEVVA
jgi:pimeloyl-ACP methyl ester carboxylesterase